MKQDQKDPPPSTWLPPGAAPPPDDHRRGKSPAAAPTAVSPGGALAVLMLLGVVSYLVISSDSMDGSTSKTAEQPQKADKFDLAETPSEAWFTKTSGGMLNAAAIGTNGSGIGVNCQESNVVVMFSFGQALQRGPRVRVSYSADDADARTVQALVVDPQQNPGIAAVVTSANSTLMKVLRAGSFLTFVSENRSGKIMIGIVTLKGSARALQRLPCI